ncbi:MAG: DUF4159 domain-containing protein [Vicinamibacterales bacterium]
MRRLALIVVLALAAAASGEAQRRGGGRGGGFNVNIATPESFDGAFQFCRVAFRQNRYGDGGNWSVDYPRADMNLSIRLSELTKTHVSFDSAHDPNHLVVRLTDEALFQCPFIMMTEVGSALFDQAEADALRTYLLKGGFLWADDFWGDYAWEVWAEQIGKAMPPAQYPFVDLPMDHPIFRSQFIVTKVPQISSINFWAGSGGGTSERGAESAEVHTRAILDKQGRIMVLATHNTDFGDSFEQEAANPQYFLEFSVPGYAFGIDVLLYAMTH